MMRDYEGDVIELEDAKARMVEAKRRIRVEAEREARRVAALKIAEQVEQIEVEFAHRLADAYERGVPQSVLRSRVLRTNDWATWTKWRDLAGIPLERSSRANPPDGRFVRRKSDADYEWNDDYTMLTVYRVPKVGVRAAADLPRPVVFVDWATGSRVKAFLSDRVFTAISEYRARVVPFAEDLVSEAVREGNIPAGLSGRYMSEGAEFLEHAAESERLNAGWLS